MIKKNTQRPQKKEKGFALAVVLVFLLILSILAIVLVTVFSGVGAKETLQAKSSTVKFESAQAGIDRGVYNLRRPDDVSQAHAWSQNYTNTFTLNIEGESVTVTVQDTMVQ